MRVKVEGFKFHRKECGFRLEALFQVGNISLLPYVLSAAGRRFPHIKGEINAQF
jgi:hypothetical protein